MKIRPDDLKNNSSEKNAAPDQMLDWASRLYYRFDKLVSFYEDDSIWLMGFKVIMRILGIIILLLLSPFFILGLILAFAAVM